MKALRWILFSLLAFGLGTGIALVVHPPTIGIPTATASGLSNDLSKIREYAEEGRCSPVRGRLRGASSKIQNLPSSTSQATIDQLSASLETVREQALQTCQRINDARIAKEQAEQEAAEPSTPEPSTPVEPSTPTEPDTGDDGGDDDAPDPGTGEATSPDQPGATDPGTADPGTADPGGTPGGVQIPSGDAIRQRLDDERRRWEENAREIRKAWGGR